MAAAPNMRQVVSAESSLLPPTAFLYYWSFRGAPPLRELRKRFRRFYRLIKYLFQLLRVSFFIFSLTFIISIIRQVEIYGVYVCIFFSKPDFITYFIIIKPVLRRFYTCMSLYSMVVYYNIVNGLDFTFLTSRVKKKTIFLIHL